MVIRGTARITCPGCDTPRECKLVQTINPRTNPDDKRRLLDGTLNVLVCECGRRSQLAANLLFHDPDREYFCQVVPGGEQAMEQAAAAFAASGATGTQRLVPSQNALVEKVKWLDAGLDDRAIEMAKVLLLASIERLDRVLLFDAVDGDVIRWLIFDDDGNAERVSSPLAAYERIAARERSRPSHGRELRIDRAWAIDAVKAMIADSN